MKKTTNQLQKKYSDNAVDFCFHVQGVPFQIMNANISKTNGHILKNVSDKSYKISEGTLHGEINFIVDDATFEGFDWRSFSSMELAFLLFMVHLPYIYQIFMAGGFESDF